MAWLGIPDSQIILMIPDDYACNARNCRPGNVSSSPPLNLYAGSEIDYRGSEVNVENFMRMMMEHLPDNWPRSKRLLTNAHSNILVYLSGHGGNNFLKFQDQEEINAQDIAEMFVKMELQQRYNRILFMVDTCQASTLITAITAANIVGVGSSQLGENSYAAHVDPELGVSVIDRFTQATFTFLQSHQPHHTLSDLSSYYNPTILRSNPYWHSTMEPALWKKIKLDEFFTAYVQVVPDTETYSISRLDSDAYPPPPTIPDISVLSLPISLQHRTPLQLVQLDMMYIIGASIVVLLIFALLEQRYRRRIIHTVQNLK